jgi:hypothetical protein
VKYRIEILIPIFFLGYVAFFPVLSGEIANYFFKSHILLPFILVFLALIILSFGFMQLIEIGKSLQYFIVNTPLNSKLNEQTLNGAISFAYVASTLWVLYILVVSTAYSISMNVLVSEIALSFTYAFILAELILRPLKKRIEFLQL